MATHLDDTNVVNIEGGAMDIKPEDLKVECWTPESPYGMQTGRTGSGVKVTYLPTGESVAIYRHRHQHQNIEEALKKLMTMLAEAQGHTG